MKNIFCVSLLFFSICAAFGEDKLVVHEWGTFTSLQDEQGNAIGGINTDDEPVPNFVHRLAYYLLLPPPPSAGGYSIAGKGITPKCHPDVTMRLETPVLYFYPPAGWKARPVDVHVEFRGGWLSEFYPDAIFKAPGFDRAHPKEAYSNQSDMQQFGGIGRINPDAVGELSWKGLTIGSEGCGPETLEKVWLAPRDVKAATVKTQRGECEKFLFYRGVGNLDASVRIERDAKQHTLNVVDKLRILAMLDAEDHLRIHATWLVQVQADGSCAFKSPGKLEWPRPTAMPDAFKPEDFSADKLTRLKTDMREALINEGLFPDEADALLNTWEVSYFKSPGLRFFYICPEADVNSVLPLDISVPSTITRVTIGRVEIVTPEQRALLKEIASVPPLDHPESRDEVHIPPAYIAYLKLGRFRNALILDEQKKRPTQLLNNFITNNGLEAFKVE